MRRIAIILLLILIFFFSEFLLFNFFGHWFMPNLLLLLIIFFNLFLGIRYSLLVAVLAGILQDSMSTGFFGVNILSFIICAYMTTLIDKFLYIKGSRVSRLLLIFIVLILNVSCHYIFYSMFNPINILSVLRFVLLPELITTLIVANLVIKQLKKCVLKFSV